MISDHIYKPFNAVRILFRTLARGWSWSLAGGRATVVSVGPEAKTHSTHFIAGTESGIIQGVFFNCPPPPKMSKYKKKLEYPDCPSPKISKCQIT